MGTESGSDTNGSGGVAAGNKTNGGGVVRGIDAGNKANGVSQDLRKHAICSVLRKSGRLINLRERSL